MRKNEKCKSYSVKEEVKAKQLPKTTFKLLILVFFCLSDANAQQTAPASGGQSSGCGGSVSYSIGQVFYSTHTGEGGTVAEGAQ